MKYFPLVWSGLWRKPVRTVFTLLSIVTAFVLFGLLQGLNAGFARTLADLNLNRLITDLRVPGGEGIPIAWFPRIEKVPGVERVTQQAMFIGTYRSRRTSWPRSPQMS
jgi:putative ABC transport system permease protein